MGVLIDTRSMLKGGKRQPVKRPAVALALLSLLLACALQLAAPQRAHADALPPVCASGVGLDAKGVDSPALFSVGADDTVARNRAWVNSAVSVLTCHDNSHDGNGRVHDPGDLLAVLVCKIDLYARWTADGTSLGKPGNDEQPGADGRAPPANSHAPASETTNEDTDAGSNADGNTGAGIGTDSASLAAEEAQEPSANTEAPPVDAEVPPVVAVEQPDAGLVNGTTPKAALPGWALANLSLTMLGCLAAVITLVVRNPRARSENASIRQRGYLVTWRVFNVLAALSALIVFSFTENLAGRMVLADWVTFVHVLVALFQVLFSVLATHHREDDHRDQDDGTISYRPSL
ncbi:MAG: hypothetical protein LBD25_09050 [Coriobacteriales bacterium]|nr:hypothetical protein [Coriobacteriales bacterium]